MNPRPPRTADAGRLLAKFVFGIMSLYMRLSGRKLSDKWEAYAPRLSQKTYIAQVSF